MPPTFNQIDLETLVREAVSAVAVSAYARGIAIAAHIDNRLPSRFQCAAKALSEFLRHGLARTVEAGGTGTIAFGLWLDDTGPDKNQARILLEICRGIGADRKPLTRLSDLWTLPIGAATAAQPVAGQHSDDAETVLIPLPCEPDPDAPKIMQKWNGCFRNRFILHVGDVLFDQERFRVSLAAAGLEVTFAATPAAALKQARNRAENGQAIDFLVLDAHQLGAAAAELAREFRTDPRLAHAWIVLTGDPRTLELPAGDAALFDAAPGVSMPWRRLMDVLHDHARTSDAPPRQHLNGSAAARDIPSLTGRRILIAEDVATNQVLLGALLAPTGATVEIVSDGAAVLERHSEQPADLILMDLQMPGMGGIAAMRHLRALGGAAGAVRVIALTAYARSADRQLALDSGMDAYLAKPIVVAEFYDLLRLLLPEDDAEVG